jgi:hypothetical protein
MDSIRRDFRFSLSSLALLGLLFSASFAQAQATRTWVSGVGDDANPCSRTAPCKTFAGAISKTAAGGEIDVLDPGGFGAVTITKSISIEAEGVIAGVLVAGTNGIVVSAGPTDVVVIRGLTIEGLAGNGSNLASAGLSGIVFNSGAALHVENCTINGFKNRGIDFFPSGSGTSLLFVKDTRVRNNYAGGIWVQPGSGVTAKASIDDLRAERNLFGVKGEQGSSVVIRNSVAAGNTNNGFIANSWGGTVDVTVENSVSTANGGNGILSTNANATMRLSNVTITDNGIGVLSQGGGVILSFMNNRIKGNGTDGSPTSTIGQQ